MWRVNTMKHILILITILFSSLGVLHSQVPNLISYQGRVAVGTTNFNGTGQFKFVLYNPGGIISVWSNDGTSVAGSEPTMAVSLTVTKGLYSVLLGDTMSPIPASVWANGNLYLRVWFSDGTNGFQLLTPDQRLAPNGYLPDGSVSSAAIADGAVSSAKIAAGSVTSTQLAAGAVSSTQLATSAVQTANIANGAIGTVKLGNGGVTTTKLADGAVTAAKLGSDVGLWSATGGDVYRTAGNVGIGTEAPVAKLEISDGTTSLQIRPGELNGIVSPGDVSFEIFGNHTIGITDSLNVYSNLTTGGNITVKGDYYGRGHMWLHALEGDGLDGTAYLQARDYSGTSSIGLQFRSQNAGAYVNALKIAPDGKVGIGTATPATALDVTGTITASQFNLNSIRFIGTVSNFFAGYLAGNPNATGSSNNAIGMYSMVNVGSGSRNAAFGLAALQELTSGEYNVAIGSAALVDTVSGNRNTAVGANSLPSNATGNNNIGIGFNAGSYLVSGSDNIYIGNNAGGTSVSESGVIRLGTEGTHTKTMLVGNVGIGTTTPNAKLSVIGSQATGVFNASYIAYGAGSFAPVAHGVHNMSIYADGDIMGLGFYALSDERIKNIRGKSDSAADLRTLRDIQITDYRFKDEISHGSGQQKKVIAQQVEKVFPQAVNQHTGVVPDIFKKAAIKDGWVALKTEVKKGDRVRLIGEEDDAIHEVLEVKKDSFLTDFKGESKEVFVYGREVKDVRAVDYEAIAMLNVSATQELARKLEAKDAEIAALKKRLADQAATMKTLAARQALRDEALEARLARLEQSAASNAVKVALTK